MNRRSVLRGALGAAGALMGALALGRGVDARETMPEGVQGQPVMTLVTGPDPDTMVHTIFHPDGTASVLPSWDALPANEMHHMVAIPRASFAEFDPAYGMVPLTDLKPTKEGQEIGEIAIRIAYLREIYRRYPALAQNSDREREARLEANREPFPAPLLR